MICLRCRGLGMIGGCPDCGKSRENQTQNIPEQLPDEVCESVCIPDYFKGIKWDKQIFLNSHKDEYAVSSLERYAEILTRMHNIFSSGNIPNKSCLITAHGGMGKLTWAYSCMQEALKHGHTVMPILDNTQYKRLNIISSDRISSRYLKQYSFTIDKYNNADVVFLTIDPDNFQGSFRTVESLISKRSRLGKQTFIISRFSSAQMSILDYDHSFESTLTVHPGRDKNKYLEIIGG